MKVKRNYETYQLSEVGAMSLIKSATTRNGARPNGEGTGGKEQYQFYFYILAANNCKIKLTKIPFAATSENIKYLGINLCIYI